MSDQLARPAGNPTYGTLAGRQALVTGGAGDIGAAATADLLARGARVVVADIDLERGQAVAEKFGPEVLAIHLDLEDESSVASAVREMDRLGGCDVLISNAGRARVEKFTEMDPGTWDQLYRINQRGPIQLTHGLLPAMVENGYGRLVYVSSDGARAGASGEAVYASTKSALFGFAKSIARESARFGVTANVVCPGPVRGRMINDVLGDRRHEIERFERSIPMKRLGEPQEVASLVGWLASDDASYITGQIISVSGGITMH